MANATVLPTLAQIVFFQWATPTAPSPKLSAPVGPSDTTLTFTSAPLDTAGAVVTEAFLMGIRNDEGYVETVYVPAGALSGDGLTATGVVRGIELSGLDWTAGDSNNAATHQQDSPIFCNITGVMQAIQFAAMQGTIATGGSGLIMGTDAAGTVTISRSTGAGTNAPWLRYNNTGSEVEFSDDGVAWTAINDVTASNLVDISAADTTPGYLGAKLVSATGGIDFNILGAGANETLNLTVDLSEAGVTPGTLAGVVSDVTATMDEINQSLDGISANVTDTNLNTLTAGAASDASALHTHGGTVVALTAGETIDGSVTPQAVCMSGEGRDCYALTYSNGDYGDSVGAFASLTFGSADATFKRSQSFTYTNADCTTITVRVANVNIRKEGAPTDNVRIVIYDDDTNKPGSAIANGESTWVSGTGFTTAASDIKPQEFVFATPPTIVSGTKYHLVLEREGVIDAVNYYAVQRNSNSFNISNYHSTYTASTGVWSAGITGNSGWFYMYIEFQLTGGKIFKADSNVDNRARMNFIGFTTDNVTADDTVNVITNGTVAMTVTEGAHYWVDTTAGAITDTIPTSHGIIEVGQGGDGELLINTSPLKKYSASRNFSYSGNAETDKIDVTFWAAGGTHSWVIPCGLTPLVNNSTVTNGTIGTAAQGCFYAIATQAGGDMNTLVVNAVGQ
jgi:hypothetical protein